MQAEESVFLGKLASEDLTDLLKHVRGSNEILVPPAEGFDCGVHKLGRNKCVVISTDPCINVPKEHFGWLLFHYSASDLSVFGASPQFCTIELLGPPGTRPAMFNVIMNQFCRAADDVGTLVITGHTGNYDGLNTLLGVCTAYGIIGRKDLITPAGAKSGDLILCSKPVGLEVLTNFASYKKDEAKRLFGDVGRRRLEKQIRMQSCFVEARLLWRMGAVSAMHDVTEGGVVTSLNEMAKASNLGFILHYEDLPILPELDTFSENFNLSKNQILSMSSTGTLLAAIPPRFKEKVLTKLRARGIDSRIIGVFTRSKKRILTHNSQQTDFPERSDDPYASIIGTDANESGNLHQ